MKLICYLSNGYPTIEKSFETASIYDQAGCDIVEIDFPSRDPYLEGEYISKRMKDALSVCDNYEKYMENIVNIKKTNPDMKVLLLSYESTIEEIGVKRFIDFCKKNKISDMIYVGAKHKEIKNAIIENDIKVSCYIQFCMNGKEIEEAIDSNGFIYMQAKPIGSDINPKYPTLKDCIKYIRDLGVKKEIYAGVGIYEEKDIQMVKKAKADGAFIGSTILKLQDDNKKLLERIKAFKKIAKD